MRPIAPKPLALLVGALALTGTLAGCATAADDSANAAEQGTTDATSSSSDYTDGEYAATGDYQSPEGSESIDVSVTLDDGVITAVEVTPNATSGNAERYQTQFAGGIADVVVGVAIDDLSVDKVAGSSLTSGGFNDAIEQIKDDATA